MKSCLHIKNILGSIIKYLPYTDIILLSQCNKTLLKDIDPASNTLVNNIFLDNVNRVYFNSEDYNLGKKKNLLGDFLESKKDWKLFLKELNLNFKNYSDKEIANKVLEIFKLHLYLPDLRKENFHLEYEFSSTHLYICYDMIERRNINLNRFKKEITKEYLLNSMKNPDIKMQLAVKPIKRDEFFEKELLNFSFIFNNFINNNDYYNILGDVINYNYSKLDLLYKNGKYNYNIINFILWICHSFILYSDYVYSFINRYVNNINNKNIDAQTIFNEFIEKYEELVNCSQLINSKFENINIIFNYLNKFKSLANEIEKNGPLDLSPSSSLTSNSSSTSDSSSKSSSTINNSSGFSLYQLFAKIIKDNVYNKLSGNMINSLEILLKEYFVESFEKKESTENEKSKEDIDCDYDYNDDNMNIEDDNFDYENEDISMSEEKVSNKELIEKYMNIAVDQEINEINSKAINHTELKVSKEYENTENLLINNFIKYIDLYIEKGKSLFEIYEIIERITKSTGNTKTLSCVNKSLNLIRRTKKRLMEKSITALYKYVLQEFNKDFHKHIKFDEINQKNIIELSYIESKNDKKYEVNLNDLDKKNRMKVVELVENEMKNLITFLEEENIKSYDNQSHKDEMRKLIKDYVEECRIPYVLLMKKIIWFYYKELGYYEERNKIVISFLSHNKCSFKNESLDDTYDLRENILKQNSISYNYKMVNFI